MYLQMFARSQQACVLVLHSLPFLSDVCLTSQHLPAVAFVYCCLHFLADVCFFSAFMIHRYRLFSCGLHLFCCLLGVCNSRDYYFSRDVPCVFLFAELTFFICGLRLFTDSCLRCALNFYLLVLHKHYWCYLAYRITLINYCCQLAVCIYSQLFLTVYIYLLFSTSGLHKLFDIVRYWFTVICFLVDYFLFTCAFHLLATVVYLFFAITTHVCLRIEFYAYLRFAFIF